MSEGTLTFGEVREIARGALTPGVNGFSEFLKAVKDIGENARKGIVSNARSYEFLADKFFGEYSRYSQDARRYAEQAVAAGDARKAWIYTRYADTFFQVAQERYATSAEQWVKANAARAAEVARNAAFEGTKSAGLFARLAGPLLEIAQIYDGLAKGDWDQVAKAAGGLLFSVAFAEIAMLFLGGLAIATPLGLLGVALVAGLSAGFGTAIGKEVGSLYVTAIRAILRRDPLALDLDGDGLETVGAAADVLFDHDADGVRTGTGWVKPDDGLLVWDHNGNGQIDSGRELFGDSALKSNGQLAKDGFDALADLDTNADGKV